MGVDSTRIRSIEELVQMSSIFAGRQEQLEQFRRLLEGEKGILLIAGESGIGKTKLIKQFYQELENREEIFVGLHECQLTEENKNPYLAVLGILVGNAESKLEKGALQGRFGRLGDALIGVIQRRGEVGKAILKDLWSKTGLGDNTLNLFGEVWRETKDAKLGISLLGEELQEYQRPFVETYLDIFEAMKEAFGEKKFILMLDQFERTEMLSQNILLDFARRIPVNVFLVTCYKLVEQAKLGEGITLLEKYKAIKLWLMEAGSEIMELSGLPWEDIGEWIEAKCNKKLPKTKLLSIERTSGGFPDILEKWIESGTWDLGDLKTSQYLSESFKCSLDALQPETRDFAYRLSVLLGPLSLEEYSRLLRLGDREIEEWRCNEMIRELEQHLIFKRDDMPWFQHEKIKDFVEKNMGTELATKYHKAAAKFFEQEAEQWA